MFATLDKSVTHIIYLYKPCMAGVRELLNVLSTFWQNREVVGGSESEPKLNTSSAFRCLGNC